MLAFHLPTTVDKEPKVLVSFYRGAVVFHTSTNYQAQKQLVLVPFYRGAVVFLTESEIKAIDERFSSPFIEERLYLMMIIITESHSINGSRPLLSRSGCIFYQDYTGKTSVRFSSPFIEERLYLTHHLTIVLRRIWVLVPFYRGAVVFNLPRWDKRRLWCAEFSSPFIEERLYFR